jgi:hypothetical protein
MRRERKLTGVLGLVLCLGAFGQTSQNRNGERPADKFTETDAAVVLDHFRQALESNNQRGLLKLFDPAKMPDYPALRDLVEQFFDKYEAFQVQYRITQVSSSEHAGMVLVDFQLEMTPRGGASPNVRRRMQLRLVLAGEQDTWKIVDLTPRTLFD